MNVCTNFQYVNILISLKMRSVRPVCSWMNSMNF